MTYIELVEQIAKETNGTKKDVKTTLSAMAAIIKEQVLDNKRDVIIPRFGKFKVRHVKGGERRVPSVDGQTKTVQVVARDTMKFVSYAAKPF